MKSFRIKTLFIVALFAASAAFAQPVTIPTPPNLVLTGGAGSASTNLGLGWSAQTIVTNITQAWSATSAPPVMIVSTNYSTNTVITFADFDTGGQDYITIQQSFNCNTANSNVWYSLARSLDKRIWDTTGNLSRTNTSNGSTNVCDLYQIDMRGYAYGRVMSINWSNTSSASTWSNGVVNVIGTTTNTVPGLEFYRKTTRTTTSGN